MRTALVAPSVGMATAPSVPASGRSILDDDDDDEEKEDDDDDDEEEKEDDDDDGGGERDDEDKDEDEEEDDDGNDDDDDVASTTTPTSTSAPTTPKSEGKRTRRVSGRNFRSRFARDRPPKSARERACTCENVRGRREVSQRWQRHATKQCCAK